MENNDLNSSANSNIIFRKSRTIFQKLRGDPLKRTYNEGITQVNKKSNVNSFGEGNSFQSFYPTFNNIHQFSNMKNSNFLKKIQDLKHFSSIKTFFSLKNQPSFYEKHLEEYKDNEKDHYNSMIFYDIQRNKSHGNNYFNNQINNRTPRNKEKLNLSTISVIDPEYSINVYQRRQRKKTFLNQKPVSNLRKIVDKLINLVKYKKSYIDKSKRYLIKNEFKNSRTIFPKLNSDRGKKRILSNNIKISDISKLIKIQSFKNELQRLPERKKLIPSHYKIKYPQIEKPKYKTRNTQSLIIPRNEFQQNNYFSTSIQVVVKKLK